MVDIGLLVIGAKYMQNLSSVLSNVSKHVNNRLYVQVLSELNISEALPEIYREASAVCNSLDVRILLSKRERFHYDKIFADEAEKNEEHREERKVYKSIVLGGTFDRLHNGHKVLLSKALLLSSERLVCGITCGDMIKRKCLWELMQPFEVRENAVKEFVHDIDNRVKCETHAITDPFGPSIVDPYLEAILVSDETLKGGYAVNDKRKGRGLSKLAVEKIGLLPAKDDILKEEKISSSSRRRDLLGTFLKPLTMKTLPKPFIIGLTGGMASGKSTAARFLASNGCYVINCDLLAHELYHKGSDMALKIAAEFGNEILISGNVDRKALGRIVFASKEKLKILNGIVWPSLEAKVRELISLNVDKDYIVIDAAILLEAEWDSKDIVHQVWSCIVPPEDAIERIAGRDGLTKHEAAERLNSQISNLERVNRSDIIICTSWEPTETRRQLSLALNHLREYLNRR